MDQAIRPRYAAKVTEVDRMIGMEKILVRPQRRENGKRKIVYRLDPAADPTRSNAPQIKIRVFYTAGLDSFYI